MMQLELARQVSYATGRFGHVMLPENVYEPALHCAEMLIGSIGKGETSTLTFFGFEEGLLGSSELGLLDWVLFHHVHYLIEILGGGGVSTDNRYLLCFSI